MKAVTLFLLLAAASNLYAIPQQINYQGQLTRPDGSPLDTTVAMTFQLFDAVSDGLALWTETHPSISVTGGLFQVLLGSTAVLPDSFTANTRWLGVTVGDNTEMTPRTRMVSVGYSYRVGTVDGSGGGTITGKLNVGSGNTSTGNFANVFGENNLVTGDYSAVGGGRYNRVRGSYAVIGGGGNVSLSDSNSVSESGHYSVIGGGIMNAASSPLGFIGGGRANSITGGYSFVGGGESNQAGGHKSVVCGGGDNTASGFQSSVVGGVINIASGSSSMVGGGIFNFASGTGATVGGGGVNRARGAYSVVSGGGGGTNDSNSAIGDYSTIGGGMRNAAYGLYATIGGGFYNTVTGEYGTVPGGGLNQAGPYSFAAGYGAQANHIEAFVWGDGTEFTNSFGPQTVAIRCTGGARFYTAAGTSTGVRLSAGGGSWASLSDSTQKENVRNVNTSNVLEKLRNLRVAEWNYKSQDEKIRHMGPMAQDFHATFGLGESNTSIPTVDADGVMMAAIQELAKRDNKQQSIIEELRGEVAELRGMVQTLMADKQHTAVEDK